MRHLTVCAALADEELRHLSDIVGHVELAAGQSLFQESDEARSVYSVTAGTMKVYKLLPDGRCQVTGFLFPGDFLGLAHDETYAYSAEAVTHSALCSYPRSKLEALLKRFPQMEQRLLGMAKHELVVAQEQMLLLGRKTAKERLVWAEEAALERDLRVVVLKRPPTSRDELAAGVARLFPELLPHLPSPRKQWESEPRGLPRFVAVDRGLRAIEHFERLSR